MNIPPPEDFAASPDGRRERETEENARARTVTGRVRAAASAVETFLAAAGPQPGSVIAAHLATSEDFHAKEHGFASLTAFMQTIPDVRIVSYRGTDRVWQLGSYVRHEPPRTDAGIEIWRALASPNSWHRVTVLVHSGTGEWQLSARQDAADLLRRQSEQPELAHGGWRRVPPMPPETHSRVARSFAKRSDLGALGGALLATLKVENIPWWEMWRELLLPTPELLQAWMDTRDRELRRYVRNALRNLGLTEEVLERAVLVPGPSAHHPHERQASPQQTSSTEDERSSAGRKPEDLKAAIATAVDRMTLDELQALEVVIAAIRRSLAG